MRAPRCSLLMCLGMALAVLVCAPLPLAATARPQAEPQPHSFTIDSDLSIPFTPTDATAAAQPDTAVGEPGLAYRYVRSVGTSEQAYLADTTHLNYPWGLGTDGNSVWIAELWGHRALQYADTGAFLQAIGHAGFQLYAGQILYEVADVAVDATGHVWLVDVAAAHLLQFDADGAFVREVGRQWQPGSDNSHFVHPVSLAFDSAGNAYVSDGAPHWSADVGNQRIQVFDASGAYLTTIGVTGSVGQGNAHFHGPRHIAIYDNLLFDALKQARCRQIYQLL